MIRRRFGKDWHQRGELPPPERGRVGEGVCFATGPPPAALRASTSPFQGEVKKDCLWHYMRNPASLSSGSTLSMKYGSSFLKFTNDIVVPANPALCILTISSAMKAGVPTSG
jgi:hypothetical protein